MTVTVVIPSRLGSTRLPQKALADLGGAPMIVRVWEQARRSAASRVLVVTEDTAIAEAILAVGGEVRLTGPARNGTERVAGVAPELDGDVVVNVQGDEPFVEPELITRLAEHVRPDRPIVTAATPLLEDVGNPARVKVWTREDGLARGFSRRPIPEGGPYWLHLGIYAFYRPLLPTLVALPPSEWELAESLEQLRWLHAGYPITVVPTSAAAPGIDTPEDLARARAAWPQFNSLRGVP